MLKTIRRLPRVKLKVLFRKQEIKTLCRQLISKIDANYIKYV